MSTPAEKNHYGNLSPEYAILGLLYGQAMHGYDLHRKLVADLGQVWHLSQSQAYAILKRLESHGEISGQAVTQEKLPPKQLLHITDSGRARFEAWMNTPEGSSLRAVRMGFLTRLYFAQRYAPERIQALFAAQQAETRQSLRRLSATLQNLPADQTINRMSLEMRIRQLNLVLTWLAECETSLSPQQPSKTEPTTGRHP